MDSAPGYWMAETTGVLRPAVEHYLRDEPMSAGDIAAMRAYLRQWISASAWQGEGITVLRNAIESLTSRSAIDDWLDLAEDEGIDPL